MNNTNNDNNVKQALDDIFGSDFIEIDSNNNAKNNNDDYFNISPNEDDSSDINDNITINDNEENIDSNNIENTDNNISENTTILNDDVKADNDSLVIENEPDEVSAQTNIETNNVDNNIRKVNNKYSKKNIILYFVIGFLLGLILVFAILKNSVNKEKVINCSYKLSNKGFIVTDEYKITYKNKNISYIEGTYKYTSLTEEYKPQVEVIKEQKLPVIINSNGMSGFTHLYEISDTYLTVNSYYDFSLIDFNIVDKNDNKTTPISYLNFNSSTTIDSLKNDLIKQKYNCVNSN